MGMPSKFWPIVSVPIENEGDVVAVRQRAHRIAELLGFERQDQTRIATAVSELARNAFSYAGGGRAEFALDPTAAPQRFVIRIWDLAARGKGVIVVSSDLPELLGICHRIIVFSRGAVAGELPRDRFSERAVLELAYRNYLEPGTTAAPAAQQGTVG